MTEHPVCYKNPKFCNDHTNCTAAEGRICHKESTEEEEYKNES
jgi:hypothetical protein